MLRRILQIVIWLSVFAYLAISLAFTERMEETQIVDHIGIDLVDGDDFQFINSDDVIGVLKQHGFKITGMPVDSINRLGVKEAVCDIPEVKDAKVFYTPDGELHISIWQRRPVVRIKSGRLDFFLDEDNMPIPFSTRFTPKVMVITGTIQAAMAREKLFDLAVFIRQDPFFSALVQEIHVDQKQQLEIIPRIGDQRIFMGDADDYEWKLTKLKVFYEKALPNLGWSKYSSIDLRFKDQVVCKKNENGSTI